MELYNQQQQSAPEVMPKSTNSNTPTSITTTVTSATTTNVNCLPQPQSVSGSQKSTKNIYYNQSARKTSVPKSQNEKPFENVGRQQSKHLYSDDKSFKQQPAKYQQNTNIEDDEIIDLRSNPKEPRHIVPVSEMYNADIDYMNKYLRSLPDYNELNNKINREFLKCEAMYDQLQTMNSELKNNPLAKSSSYQNIYNQRYGRPGSKTKCAIAANNKKISRSTSSSIIPLRSGGNDFGLSTSKMVCQHPINEGRQLSTNTTHYQSQQILPSVLQQPITLQKSCSSNSCSTVADTAGRSSMNSKQFLNDFWSDNIAKSNNQKFGWNYSKLMAASKEDIRAKFDPMQSSTQNFLIKKNLSLSQLDQRIRQDLSKDDLIKLICNEPKRNNQDTTLLSKKSVPDHKPITQQSPNASTSKISNFLRPLTKSISQSSVTCSSQTSIPVVTTAPQTKTITKPSSKSNIPNFFRPLYKSTSNTHVFALATATTKHEPETFVQRTGLAKSSSSSSIPLASNHQSAGAPFFLRKTESSTMFTVPGSIVVPQSPHGWTGNVAPQRQISKNNDLLKNYQTVRQPGCVQPSLQPLSVHFPNRVDNLFNKQQQPNKIIVDDSSANTFNRVSTVQKPVTENTFSRLEVRTNPSLEDEREVDAQHVAGSTLATRSPRMIKKRLDEFVNKIDDSSSLQKLSEKTVHLSQQQQKQPQQQKPQKSQQHRQPRPLPPPLESSYAGFTESVIRADLDRKQTVRSIPSSTIRSMNNAHRFTASVQKAAQGPLFSNEPILKTKSGLSNVAPISRPTMNQHRLHNISKIGISSGTCCGGGGVADGAACSNSGCVGEEINWLEEHQLIQESSSLCVDRISSVCLLFVYLLIFVVVFILVITLFNI